MSINLGIRPSNFLGIDPFIEPVKAVLWDIAILGGEDDKSVASKIRRKRSKWGMR